MKRFLSFLLVSLLSISIFSLTAFAASESGVECGSSSEFDSTSDYYSDLAASKVVAAPSVSSDSVSLQAGSSGSFIPSLTLDGAALISGRTYSMWLDFVTYGQHVFYSHPSTNKQSHSLAQVNSFSGRYVLSGFQEDSTYTGVAFFQTKVVRASKAAIPSDYLFYAGDFSGQADKRVLLTDFLVTSLSCYSSDGSRVPVYYSRVLSDDGAYFTYTFYVLLQDYYIAPSNGVVATNSVVIDVTWSMASAFYYTATTVAPYELLPYYTLVNQKMTYLSRSFSGTVESGKHTFDGDNRQDIANSQASLSESQHDDLINGFDDSAGNAANKSLEDGLSSYESEEQKAHDDFNKAMDDYTNPDLSSYKSGFAFISSAAVSWWNALGMFKVILLVGFGLMIFNFISRYRGG